MKGHKYKNSVLYRKLHSSRAWVCISVLLALIVDIAVLTITLISGIFNEHTIVVFVLTALDIALLVAVSKTNFRFTYGRIFPIVYVCINVAAYALLLFLFSQGLFSTTAFLFFVGVHLLSVLSLIFCIVDASKRGKKVKAVALGVLAAFTAGSAFFVKYTVDSGVFGQGTGYKALYYAYDSEKDGYVVTDVTSGFGTKILIPETFNDKKVVSVNALVFNDLENVILECDGDTTFYNIENATLDADLKIHAKKATVDQFKATFVKDALNATDKNNLVLLANAVEPSDLAKDEVFVSFKYRADQIEDMNNTLLKTWYGKKGDEFDLKTYAATLDYEITYAKNYDPMDEEYLYNCYKNNNKRALKENSAYKQIVDESKSIELAFEDVYAITVGADNDKIAADDASFKAYAEGKRYVSASDSADLLGQLQERKGFTHTWQYTSEDTLVKTEFASLSDLFKSEDSEITIYPVWALDTPTIVSITPNQEDGYVYGDTLKLDPEEGTHDLADVYYTYSWSCYSQSVDIVDQTTSDLIIDKVKPQESEYVLTITAHSPTTSLTAESEPMTCNVSVAKKSLNVIWSQPSTAEELLYDNTYKTVSCSLEPTDIVSGDDVQTDWTDDQVRDATSYTYIVSLTDGFEELYELKNYSTSFTIQPRKVQVLWETPDFTYDQNDHAPAYTLGGDSLIPEDGTFVGVVGEASNAGTHTMEARVYESDYRYSSNYTISVGATYSYQIAPKGVTVIWDSLTEFTYNGDSQAPTADLEGVYASDSLYVNVLGGQTNASDDAYTATASLCDYDGYTASNYTIAENPTQEFTIARMVVDISWGSTALTYNGATQVPEVWANDFFYNDVVNVIVTGGQKDVGYSYTATATGLDNTNYELAATEDMPFTIEPKQISVSWSSTSLTYNGSEQKPTPTANGVCAGDMVNLTVDGGETNAGSGYLVQVTGHDNSNYELSGTLSTSFSIAQKGVQINWTNTSLTYNATAQKPTATARSSDVCAGDLVEVTVSGAQTNAGSYSASATITDDNYYISSGASRSFTISPKNVELTWSNASLTYNGTSQKPTAQITSGVCAGDLVDVTVTGAQTNAGSYTAQAGLDNANYAISAGMQSKTFTIARKNLSLTWSNTSLTYNGTSQKPTAEITGGVCAGDSVIATVSGAQTNAGSYSATASINNTNYAIASGMQSKSFTIAKKTITFTFDAGNEFEYTGSPVTMEGTLSGAISGDDVTVTYKYYSNGAPLASAPTAAGSYEVRVELSSAFKTNYTLSGTTTKNFTVRSEESAA